MFNLTVVSCALIVVDYKVLAEMTDGSVVELSTPWGAPDEGRINMSYGSLTWRHLTKAQLVERAREHNADCKLHLRRVQEYGATYAAMF